MGWSWKPCSKTSVYEPISDTYMFARRGRPQASAYHVTLGYDLNWKVAYLFMAGPFGGKLMSLPWAQKGDYDKTSDPEDCYADTTSNPLKLTWPSTFPRSSLWCLSVHECVSIMLRLICAEKYTPEPSFSVKILEVMCIELEFHLLMHRKLIC